MASEVSRSESRTDAPAGRRTEGEGRKPYNVDALVDVAIAVFTRKGYDATSMEDLAKAAGITKSSFYHHVSGKEELLNQAVSRAVGRLVAILAEPEATEGPAVDRLRHIIRQVTGVVTEHTSEVALFMRVRGNTPTEVWAIEQRRDIDHRVAMIVEQAMAEGAVHCACSPAMFTRLVFGMINSITEWYRPGPLKGQDIADVILQLALST